MEIIDPQQKREFEQRSMSYGSGQPETNSRILAGFVVILIGGLLLAQKLGAYFPDWLFSWQTLLIAIGIFVGTKHNFRMGGWLIPIFIGFIFLLDRFSPDLYLRPYFLPIILIAIGSVMILTPKRHRRNRNWSPRVAEPSYTPAGAGEEVMESVSIFGGVKRNIISKSFKGGESVTVFGGSEINLMQADIQGKVKLEIVQIFGGTKLIIPANWQVQSELVSLFGDIQDTRVSTKDSLDPDKILVIEGFSMLGGISIKSY
jgi:predicted membrane protein